jgi:hypothetical protein
VSARDLHATLVDLRRTGAREAFLDLYRMTRGGSQRDAEREWRDLGRALAPYPEFCSDGDRCAGLKHCPRETACCD